VSQCFSDKQATFMHGGVPATELE